MGLELRSRHLSNGPTPCGLVGSLTGVGGPRFIQERTAGRCERRGLEVRTPRTPELHGVHPPDSAKRPVRVRGVESNRPGGCGNPEAPPEAAELFKFHASPAEFVVDLGEFVVDLGEFVVELTEFNAELGEFNFELGGFDVELTEFNAELSELVVELGGCSPSLFAQASKGEGEHVDPGSAFLCPGLTAFAR